MLLIFVTSILLVQTGHVRQPCRAYSGLQVSVSAFLIGHLLIRPLLTAAGSVPVGREKADVTNVGSVGAPMAGAILEVIAKPGAQARHP